MESLKCSLKSESIVENAFKNYLFSLEKKQGSKFFVFLAFSLPKRLK